MQAKRDLLHTIIFLETYVVFTMNLVGSNRPVVQSARRLQVKWLPFSGVDVGAVKQDWHAREAIRVALARPGGCQKFISV